MKFVCWKDYELIDASCGERLERWADVFLIRPDPQVIWKTEKNDPRWNNVHARYIRSNTGGGSWKVYKKIPESWQVKYHSLAFNLKLMNFKHTGVFPEQAVNWQFISDVISNSKKQFNVLNLFAYTGGATLAASKAGAKVCHVDASKGMTLMAKENADISSLSKNPIRWIVDDCVKFAKREKKRGNLYDGIIMDPPSYGRGPGGEVWKIEDDLYELVSLCTSLLSKNSKFFILNSYTTGLSPSAMEYLLGSTMKCNFGGKVFSYEIGLKVSKTSLILPCGSTAVWLNV